MSNSRAMILMVAAMAFFAVSDACIKLAAHTLETGQILLASGVFSLAFFAILLRRENTRFLSRRALGPAMLIRTGGETFGSLGIVAGLSLLPLSTVTAITQAQPLMMTAAAAVFLGETVGWRRWMAVGLGFLGVLIVLRPGAESFDTATLWLVLGVVGLTVRDIGTRRLPPETTTAFASIWAMAAITVLGGILMILGGGWQPVGAVTWIWLAGIGLSVSFAFLAITASLRLGELSAVAPFRYTRIVFAMGIAILVFGERPNMSVWLGATLIVGSGLYAFWRERRLSMNEGPSSAR